MEWYFIVLILACGIALGFILGAGFTSRLFNNIGPFK